MPSEHAILLNYLSRTAAQHRLACTSAWAEENLLLARQLPMDWNRLAIEKNALVAMSYVKPRRALMLLRTMDLPVSDGVGFSEDVRADAATTIFRNYWNDRRPKGVTELREMAAYLGQTGQYPYRATQAIVSDLAASSPRKERGQLPVTAQSLVLDAYSYYQRGSKFGIENDDFVLFLQTLRPILPARSLRQGLELAVERLMDTDSPTEKQTYLAHVQTEKGDATFHRRQEMLLFDLLPLIREIDPDWADQIVRRDPAMAQAEGNSGKEITSESITVPGGSGSPSAQDYGLQLSRAQAAGEMAKNNPDGAMQLAQTIASPSIRASALANIANAIGQSAPNQTKEIENSIGSMLPGLEDSEDRLETFSALARTAAAAGDKAAFGDALNKCFALGEELFEEDLDAHPEKATYAAAAYNVLDGVVKSGAHADPGTVTSKVQEIRNVALKAYLLQSLAEALYAEQQTSAEPQKRSKKSAGQIDHGKKNTAGGDNDPPVAPSSH